MRHLFETEVKVLSHPLPISIKCYKPEYLFAGKMHALLFRLWDNRVKGRDWYDIAWFTARNTHLNLKHLESKMLQSGHLETKQSLDSALLNQLFKSKIEQCDFNSAKNDIARFIIDQSILECWNKEYFMAIADSIVYP